LNSLASLYLNTVHNTHIIYKMLLMSVLSCVLTTFNKDDDNDDDDVRATLVTPLKQQKSPCVTP